MSYLYYKVCSNYRLKSFLWVIWQLAEKSGVNIETIRYYEKIEMLPKPRRTEAGYRIYSDTDYKRLVFIKRCWEW